VNPDAGLLFTAVGLTAIGVFVFPWRVKVSFAWSLAIISTSVAVIALLCGYVVWRDGMDL